MSSHISLRSPRLLAKDVAGGGGTSSSEKTSTNPWAIVIDRVGGGDCDGCGLFSLGSSETTEGAGGEGATVSRGRKGWGFVTFALAETCVISV